MAKTIKLDNLLQAIHQSVLEAQLLTEQQHLEQLDRYFEWPEDENKKNEEMAAHIHRNGGIAKTWAVEVPNMHPDAEKGSTTTIQVPLMSLIPPTAIKIKNMEVEFKVALGDLVEDRKAGRNLFKKNQPREEGQSIGIDLGGVSGGGFFGKKSSLAKIKITFEAGEPAESFLRINDHLIKSII
ncbi:DUF2589 domain-containing protein [Cyclobacterium plantarum]|uniref:DUF2589 domain-containing protein n=1 Tax=Cyclobacterium plantarum TaxID=2716263 RepID=A0ABX0H5P8_9BACT|nr:DUF2589 domain-containing protein [Cyclobacterium plantarum]NHE55567.1 DUF2589 domain-containing protein [Cyclobacterium plantarum]